MAFLNSLIKVNIDTLLSEYQRLAFSQSEASYAVLGLLSPQSLLYTDTIERISFDVCTQQHLVQYRARTKQYTGQGQRGNRGTKTYHDFLTEGPRNRRNRRTKIKINQPQTLPEQTNCEQKEQIIYLK